MYNNPQIKQLISWSNDKKKVCPKLKHEINDLVELALNEIEDGGSVSHEIQLCMSDIEELIKENCN
jgi:hypothetical protein